jgi:hypothetical protein
VNVSPASPVTVAITGSVDITESLQTSPKLIVDVSKPSAIGVTYLAVTNKVSVTAVSNNGDVFAANAVDEIATIDVASNNFFIGTAVNNFFILSLSSFAAK